ncbi:hypothetical protein P153DRAFT_429988 [Dothidotthia symphoricarpi CBS 119687]|uniref:Magnesium transporter n=1 Tax=Dothidotthia symphoricarpi CBS 119687 TaxID=1392245 RepID=A0A6A6AIH0_9PLEO|nr:uncharacterized protein P153DRAFT_429988 [Dothidotthia symphoricarpi CBS 119687]KAF2131762.1 hypothetical protein P153DRAFT_429988 [Dothidotthia symphoricarpi CBS 119687]
MAFLGTALNTMGALFLTHAVYSTHEHTASYAHTPLPNDITIELLLSILLLSTGIVLSFPRLKPIQYATWAGQLSSQGPRGEGKYTREGEEILTESDPFSFLGLDGGIGGTGEGRRGFWDVRGKRGEYAAWARSGGK